MYRKLVLKITSTVLCLWLSSRTLYSVFRRPVNPEAGKTACLFHRHPMQTETRRVLAADGSKVTDDQRATSEFYFAVHTVSKCVSCLHGLQLSHHTLRKRCKAVPLHAWSGPEGSRKLRFQDFMTTAQDGGKVVSLTHRPPLPQGNTPGTHFC